MMTLRHASWRCAGPKAPRTRRLTPRGPVAARHWVTDGPPARGRPWAGMQVLARGNQDRARIGPIGFRIGSATPAQVRLDVADARAREGIGGAPSCAGQADRDCVGHGAGRPTRLLITSATRRTLPLTALVKPPGRPGQRLATSACLARTA